MTPERGGMEKQVSDALKAGRTLLSAFVTPGDELGNSITRIVQDAIPRAEQMEKAWPAVVHALRIVRETTPHMQGMSAHSLHKLATDALKAAGEDV